MTTVDKVTAEPRSDQWNSDDFIGGPKTFTIASVKVGTAEQKYDIELVEGGGRCWRPPLTMLRLLIAAWTDEAAIWKGRRVTLYRDESIRFGPETVGGIRVSHMSHLPGNKTFTARLTSSRGRKTPYTVEPLPDAPLTTPKPPSADKIIDAFSALGVTLHQLETRVCTTHDLWTPDDLATLATLGKSIKAGTTTVFEEFDTPDEPEQAAFDETGDMK